jgi:hypothetical protein
MRLQSLPAAQRPKQRASGDQIVVSALGGW